MDTRLTAHMARLRRIGYCLLPLALGAGAALVLLLLAGGPPRPAYAGTLTYPGCGASIQACINSANSGDTILISAGDYTESLTLSKAVSLTGALSSTTILHAQPNTRVLTVTGVAVNSSVIISGLAFAGGHVAGIGCPAACGGGILLNNNAQPSLINVQLISNTADGGGGLYTDGNVILTGTQFVDNIAVFTGGGAFAEGQLTLYGGLFQNNQCTASNCHGGGLWALNLSMVNTQFLSNTSTGDGGGAYGANISTLKGGVFQNNQCSGDGCYGGGLFAYYLAMTNTQFLTNTSHGSGGGVGVPNGSGYEDVALSGGVFQNNNCTGNYCQGGGLFAFTLKMTGTEFLSNTSQGAGGGASVEYSATVQGGLFQQNRCIQTGCSGGGLLGTGAGGIKGSQVELTDTVFISNAADGGGGGASIRNAVLHAGLFQGNQTTGGNGGGLAASYLVLTDTQFLSNTAQEGGGGISLGGGATLRGALFQGNQCILPSCSGGGLWSIQPEALVLTDVQFLSNSAGAGGGIFAVGPTMLQGGLFLGNQSSDQGGGLFADSTLAMTGTQFVGNTATGHGGGLADSSGDSRIVNVLFARNAAAGSGAALYLTSPGSTTILFTTIASPTIGSSAAIEVVSGSVGITDTIISSYTTGISLTGGSAFDDHNLFFNVLVTATAGVASSGHSLIGDPLFVNPGSQDYHLGSGSAAVDAGTDGGVTTDFENDPRPLGIGFDIGFDEWRGNAISNVGVTKSASAAARQPGQTLTYTLVFSNAGPYIAAGVRLTDLVPANLTAISYTSSGATLLPLGLSTYSWRVAYLVPGAGGIITVTGVLSGGLHGSVFTNTAAITAAFTDTNPANNFSAVSVTVANVAPVAADDVYTLPADSTLTVTVPGVLGNDSDANHDALTAALVPGPVTGRLTLRPDGSFTYRPPPGFVGVVSFTYRANDGLADSNTATVTITVTAVEHKLYLPLLRR